MYRHHILRSRCTPRHVLIIEDNPDGRESLRMLLSLLGQPVDAACDGLEGVKKALALRPDIALIDIGLPLLNGYEVARRIRAALGPKVVLLAYTAYDPQDTGWDIGEAGFNGYLVKPVELKELIPWLEKEYSRPNDCCGAGCSAR